MAGPSPPPSRSHCSLVCGVSAGGGLPRLGKGPWGRHLPQLPLAEAAFQKQTLSCAAQPPPRPLGLWLPGSPWWWRGGTLRLQGRGRSRGGPEPRAGLETWHLPGMRVGGGARAASGVGFSPQPVRPTRVGRWRGAGGGGGSGGRACAEGLSWAAAQVYPVVSATTASENLCPQACHVSRCPP